MADAKPAGAAKQPEVLGFNFITFLWVTCFLYYVVSMFKQTIKCLLRRKQALKVGMIVYYIDEYTLSLMQQRR